jgi:CheY-like chemotaxis protein
MVMKKFYPVERPLVLYVENNPDDVALFQLATKKCRAGFELQAVTSVEEAERFLQQQGTQRKGRPALVLLDYNLGRVHTGMELLCAMHREGATSFIPVIVYCGDEFQGLVQEAYESGADYFLQKPSNYGELQKIVRCLDQGLRSDSHSLEEVRELPEYRAPGAHPGPCRCW